MKRITIRASQDVLDKLRLEAANRRVSLATVVRETLEDYAAEHPPEP